jgi:putative flippase GtrA
MNPFFFKIVKYGVVGFTGMIIDFTATWFLKEKAKINRFIANSIGFTIAAISNYLLNKYWTFHSQNTNVTFEFASFFLIALIGLLINNLVIFLLNNKLKMNFYFSKLIAIGVVTSWNFLLNYYFTFSVR